MWILQAEHRNMDSISKYISGIRKDTPKRYRPILEEQLNSLFEYLKEPKDYVELLNDINKKSHLIPCLHMTQEKENERFFLFSDTLENLVRKNDENSCLLALDIYNKWLSPALQEKALQEEPFYMAYVFRQRDITFKQKNYMKSYTKRMQETLPFLII